MNSTSIENLILVVAEIVTIFCIFSAGNWLLGFLFEPLIKLPALKRWQKNAEVVQRNLQRKLGLCRAFVCLAVALINGWFLYSGVENLREYTLTLIKSIPPEFWFALAAGIAKSGFLLWVVGLSVPYLNRLVDNLSDRAKNIDDISANDESIAELFHFLKINLRNILWLFAIASCTVFLQFPKLIPEYLYIAARIYLILVIGKVMLEANTILIDTLDALSIKYSSPDNLLRFYERLRHLIPLAKKCLEWAIYASVASLAIDQIDTIADFALYGPKIIQILGVILGSRVFEEVAKLLLDEVMLANLDKMSQVEKQRQLTMLPLLKSVLKYFVYFVAFILILNALNIDPTPILAGAGILSLAIGMGAQTLLQDLVAGMFILFENYYLVGDFVKIDDIEGLVTAIELRTTRISFKDKNYIIPNGEIKKIVNYSKEYSLAEVEVGVAYNSELNVVYGVLEDLARHLKNTYDEVIELTKLKGIAEFGEYQLLLQTSTKVKPGTQRRIERAFREMIKEAFDREGIEIPFISPEDL